MASSSNNGSVLKDEYVRQLLPKVRSVIYRMGSENLDPHDPDTFAHDALLEYQKRLQKGNKPPRYLVPWLRQVARNRFLDNVRKEKKHRKNVPLDDEGGARDQEALEEFLRSTVARRLLGEFKERIKDMPPRVKAVFAILAGQVDPGKIASKAISDEFYSRHGKQLSESTIQRYREDLKKALRECLKS